MKISLRIWILIFALAFSSMAILNLGAGYRFLIGLLVISILFILIYVKSKYTKYMLIILTFLFIFLIILFSSQKGVVIISIDKNSTFFSEGLRKGMIITSLNGNPTDSFDEYANQLSLLNVSGQSQKIEIQTTSEDFILLTNKTPDFSVSNIPRTNLKTGLDLSGGARAIVKPVNVSLSQQQMNDLVEITSNRLNVFGISDVSVRGVSDLEGNRFLSVEVAGMSQEDLRQLVGQQGKFEAKIGNETVFIGGEKDVSSVCRNDATCAGIESCFPSESGGYFCNFRFSIYLSEAAAQRHADITKNMSINATAQGDYLSEKLDLYLDDKLVDSLLISADLKGRVTTQIAISGPGSGETREDAIKIAEAQMHNLQTILITGSLPYQLEIVKLDSISPILGKEFTKNLIYLAIIVFLIVSLLIFIKYRKIKISLSVILTMFSEAFITLGIAAVISWNLDAPSIAGIVAGIGTGVDDQIVIIDESVSKESSSLKEKIKRAFFIIIGAFFATVVAMLPLFWAGAGLLRGFALTTILGVSVGILITRPAFTEIMRKMQQD